MGFGNKDSEEAWSNDEAGVVLVTPKTADVKPQEEENPLIDGHPMAPEEVNKYPSSIKYIMLNEICERFSYYGLRAILALYITNHFVGYGQDRATAIVHAFTMGAYATTVLGGLISDVWLGKYRTILYVSLIYCLGSATLSLTAIDGVTGHPPHPWGMALGLILVALGTGGIKPLVSAFVGDQFTTAQAHLLERVYRLFYFCINLGSVFSTLITPVVRTQLGYAPAFGLPAILLVAACVIFWSGRSKYRMQPPQGSVLKDSCKIIYSSLSNFVKHGRGSLPKDKSILFLAEDKYPEHLVRDVGAALSVLLVFLPLPFFWALFDQHSTRWIFQAQAMDRTLFGGKVTIEPDQVPSVNPILVLLLVPVFDQVIYPTIARFFNFRPLQRMAVGMVFAALSFVAAAFVQGMIDDNIIIDSSSGSGSSSSSTVSSTVHVAWQLPQYALLTCGEIMVSITGLEFAYTQAPKSMKSLIMAGWQLTVAFGNLLVVMVAELAHMEQWKEFIFYAGLMIVMDLIFVVVAYYYKYVNTSEKEKETN